MAGVHAAVLGGGLLPLVATATTPAAGSCFYNSGSAETNCNAQANSTCTVTGASGSTSYSWVLVSGTALNVINGTTATATFSRTDSEGVVNAVYRCDVTDGAGRATSSNNVNVELTFDDIAT